MAIKQKYSGKQINIDNIDNNQPLKKFKNDSSVLAKLLKGKESQAMLHVQPSKLTHSWCTVKLKTFFL